jgi:hypothetical protein
MIVFDNHIYTPLFVTKVNNNTPASKNINKDESTKVNVFDLNFIPNT